MGDAPDQPRVKRSRFESRPGDPAPPAGQASAAPALSAAEKLAKAKELLAKKDALKAQLQALKDRKAASTAQQDAAARAARPGGAAAAAAKQPAPATGPQPEDFYDPTLVDRSRKRLSRRQRADFDFVRQGPFQQDFHSQARLKALSRDALERQLHITPAEQAQPEAAPAPAPYEPPPRALERDPIPDVEWWDAAILLGGAYEPEGLGAINQKKLTIYIEHPVPIEPPAEDAPPPPMPLLLTAKERKKLRTQRRLEKEKEKQELIRQGLLEPPKPKMKLSTFYRSLGTEAAADPTAIERQVRADQEARAQAHEDRNLANKLTPAEAREKRVRKLTGAAAEGGARSVTLFRVRDLSAPQHRFKVRANAEELHMTGCALITGRVAVVVAEGGPKAQKKYAHVLLSRIKWAGDAEEGGEAEEAGRPRNGCDRVWSGTVKEAAFPRFLVQQCGSAGEARAFLAARGVGHYWDLATAEEPEQ